MGLRYRTVNKSYWLTAFRDPDIAKQAQKMIENCMAHKCRYLSPIGSGYGHKYKLYFCNYLCMTGQRRGCDSSVCEKWKEKKNESKNS